MTKVVRVDLDRPLQAIEVESQFRRVLLVVIHAGTVIGEIALPAAGRVEPELIRSRVAAELDRELRWHLFRTAADRATRPGPAEPTRESQSVSLVVQPLDGGATLERCMEAVRALSVSPLEVVVAEEAGGAGELLALVPDRWALDPGWLDDLESDFRDPLVIATVGYAGGTGAKAEWSGRRRMLCGATLPPGAAAAAPGRTAFRLEAGGPVILRRSFVEAVGSPLRNRGQLAHLLYLALSSGHRAVANPSRISWAERAPDRPSYAAHALRCLVRRRRVSVRPTPPPRSAASVRSEELPTVSLVIPSYNRREKLRALLQGLSSQTLPPERFEVIVAIDGSTDGSAAMARELELPVVKRVLELPNRGVAASRNAGVREAANEVLVHLDDDMVPAAGFLEAHALAQAGGDHTYVGIGYAAAVLEGSQDLWAAYQRAAWEDHYLRKAEPDHPWTYFDFSVGNSSMRRSLLDAVGGFDESMRRHDDQELGVRLVRGGARFGYHQDAFAWHHFELDLGAQLRQVRAQATHDVGLAGRYPQLKSEVGAGGMSRPTASGLSTRATLAFRLPLAVNPALRFGVPVIHALERLGGRRVAMQLARDLAAVSYVRGLRDCFPTVRAFREFIAPVWDGAPVRRQELDLTKRQLVEIPPEGGRMELVVTIGDLEVTRVDALEAAREWNRGGLVERVAAASVEPSRSLVGVEELLRLLPRS